MFDPQFEFKIEDEDHFELQEKYKLLEIECGRVKRMPLYQWHPLTMWTLTQDGSDATFTQTDLSPEDITGWTPEKVEPQPRSQLMRC